jgi:hypothetical protein
MLKETFSKQLLYSKSRYTQYTLVSSVTLGTDGILELRLVFLSQNGEV